MNPDAQHCLLIVCFFFFSGERLPDPDSAVPGVGGRLLHVRLPGALLRIGPLRGRTAPPHRRPRRLCRRHRRPLFCHPTDAGR